MKYKNAARRFGPFAIVLSMVSAYLLFLELSVISGTNGFFSYPIDDVYIHMQVARNLAFNGTWGIQPGVFASATSSILYPMLLSILFKVFGLHDIIPFLVNCLAGGLLLFVADKWLLKQGMPPIPRTIAMLLSVFLMPLPILIIMGMEHTFQLLITFLFITTLAEFIGSGTSTNQIQKGLPLKLFILSILTTGIRYEGIFVIAVGLLFLIWYKKPITAILVALAGALPTTIFGLYSISKGSHFLPNSVLLKSPLPFPIPGIKPFLRAIFNHFFLIPSYTFPVQIGFLSLERLLFALPIMFLLARVTRTAKRQVVFFLVLVLGVSILHMALASSGWYFRYEAYLLFCGTLVSSLILYQSFPHWGEGKGTAVIAISGFLLLMIFAPAFTRAGEAFLKIRQSCVNIFEQQRQTARFIRIFYNHSPVAVNDLGAASYFTDASILDLWGLGDIEVCNHLLLKTMTASWTNQLCTERKVRFAVTFKKVADQYLSDWVKVAGLEITNNFSSADSLVEFYSPTRELARELKSNLLRFQPAAPRTIRFIYY